MMLFLARLTRWQEWYESKAPLFFVAGFSWIWLQSAPVGPSLGRFVALVLFVSSYLAFGYAVNDYFDRDVDRRAGKPNTIGALRPGAAIAWLLALAGMGAIVLLPFHGTPWVGIAAILSYLFALAYSMPPVRFKERGSAGLLVSAVAQRSLPLVVGMAIFADFSLSSWLLVLLFALIGIRWIMVHQLIDLPTDEHAQVSTFTRQHGPAQTLWLMKMVVFPAEVACLLAWLLLSAQQAPALLLMVPAYAGWLLIRFSLWRGVGPMFTWTSYWRLPLADFYFAFWPLYLALLLTLREPVYVVLLVFFLVWQHAYLRDQVVAHRQLWRSRSQRQAQQ